MDPLEIVSRLTSNEAKPPSTEDLAAAAQELRVALDLATQGDTPDLSVARDLRAALDQATGELAQRAAAAEQARAEAAKLREGAGLEQLGQDDSGDEGDADSDTKEDEKPKEDTEPTKTKEDAKAVAAAGITDVITRLRARAVQDSQQPKPAPLVAGVSLRAIGPAAGVELDQSAGFAQLGQVFSTHAKSLTQGRSAMVRLERRYAPERVLGSNGDQNTSRIERVLGPDALAVTAAGGLCGPGDVDHSHPICAEQGRPVRDALVQFNASRGRVTFAPAAGLSQVAGAVGEWTSETDADPGTQVKECPPVECPEEISESVDAIYRCLTIGNFQAKFSPEFWASRLELLAAAHDRAAERKALREMEDAATDVPAQGPDGGTLRNFLTAVNRAVAYDRDVNRNLTGRYKLVADHWVRDALRNQVIANQGVANNFTDLQATDQLINSWLNGVGVDPVWTYDGTYDGAANAHRVLTSPGDLPDTTSFLLFGEDAFVFLDGGTLDLGTSISDSALASTNDRQAFAESFEKVAYRGCGAYDVAFTVSDVCGCPA